MTVVNRLTPPTASPLYLREDEIRRGIELLYFGYSAMIRGADAILAREGFGRAHHRALYFIARQPGLSVGDLLRLLAITKQSLGRVLNELQDKGLVIQSIGTEDRRQRLLRLTAPGEALEAALFAELNARMAAAYGEAGQAAVTGFWAVLLGLIPDGDRAMVENLRQG
ncbi:MarR family transcriptional regulator [Novosphingobium sp. PASSN1]|uniref:MarR family winged helix-turn-helix transcriptional regulator n=1 Tax=Novosphingobium sp. PASSN1 TaxID=2015561 RepID=UPI000BD1DD45|nr:MarR family transcriptional regulator [Novosphingobium sp. PASSN1]OYU34253.1 MAG: MarR family transcriptional regulator [Novosphingobium sp. PASSN1]